MKHHSCESMRDQKNEKSNLQSLVLAGRNMDKHRLPCHPNSCKEEILQLLKLVLSAGRVHIAIIGYGIPGIAPKHFHAALLQSLPSMLLYFMPF